jgi:hypothetical protein
MTSLQLTRIDWKSVVDYVMRELSWFIEHDITPTLRTLFYRLISLEIIPNTSQTYRLSSATVKARKKGKLPWNTISDEGRLVLSDFAEEYQTPEQYVQSHLHLLKQASELYQSPNLFYLPCSC